MPDSKPIISQSNIEKEIYKTFEQIKEKKNITIVDFLNKLDINILTNYRYRKIKFHYESLIKLVLFQKLKGIRFQTQLIKYLKSNRKERVKLGIQQIPNQRTISYFTNHILDDDIKNLIDFIVKKIESISEKFGILLDVKTLQPEKPMKKTSNRTFYYQKNQKTLEISKMFKKRFSSVINLNISKNAIYSKNTLIELILHMCTTNDFAENGSKTFKLQRTIVPNGDTLLYHLKNYQNINQIKRMFMTLFEMIWETARTSNMFHRKVDIAIDYTLVHFYGNKNTPMVVEMKPDRGTTHGYRFATISIVERDNRFTLLALPVGPFDRKEDILKTLLSYASKRIKIHHLYADRGFFDSNSIEIFKRYNIQFLIPCAENSRVKKILEVMPTPTIIKDYEMGTTRFNVAIAEDEQGMKRAFATNINFDENDVGLSERLFYLYSKRWGIETSYRVKKHSYRPKTTSKNYFIRLFYFLFSALLYNLWLLADILICLGLLGVYNGKHILTSKYFGTMLISVDPGG